MLTLLFFLACKTEPIPETTDAPQITSSVQNDGGNGATPPDNPMEHNQNQPPPTMDPNNGGSVGDAVPPEDGENIGDPNIPPDTINQTGGDNPAGKNGETLEAPEGAPEAMPGEVSGGQQEPKKKPPTFIFNAQSDDSGPLYKADDGTCFVRKNWDSPPNGTMGDTEARDCPQQMASDAWSNCANGRLVKHNVGDKEGTCECEPITGGEAAVITCP